MRASLRWIDPNARYQVTLSESYAPAPQQVMTGHQLQELTVQIDRQPGSLLLRYRKEG